MSKKGLIASLVVGLVVTLSLGIYTLVSVFGGANPKPQGPLENTYYLAYRTGDVVEDFKGYESDQLQFIYPENTDNPLEAMEGENAGKYLAKLAEGVASAEVTVKVALNDKGDVNTYVVKVWHHYDTDTSAERPYIVANKNHLVELANNFNDGGEAPAYVKLGGNIDIGDLNWKPIGDVSHPYNGTFDGNGFSILNLKITINTGDWEKSCTSFADGFQNAAHLAITRGYMDLGLFGVLQDATIKDLGIDGAVISIHDQVYKAMKDQAYLEDEVDFKSIARVTAGALAGYAENTTITGVEGKSNVSVRLSAFSFTQDAAGDNYTNGIGGLLGVGRLVRISNYLVKANVINNTADIVDSYIGGVVGNLYSAFARNGASVTAEMKNTIDNVEVQFNGSLLYKNSAMVGGIVGSASNADIIHSVVSSFKVNDPSPRSAINFNMANSTIVAGAVGSIITEKSLDAALSAQYVPSVVDVKVSGLEVSMLGGRLAGVIGLAGLNYTSASSSLDEKLVVKDVAAAGSMTGHAVAGVIYQVNPGTTVSYTEDFTGYAADVELSGHTLAGYAVFNMGSISGYAKMVTPEQVGEEEPVPYEVKTALKVVLKNMGAEINNTLAETLRLLRTNTCAAGVVAENKPNEHTASIIPALKDFEVSVTASNGVNYAGVAQTNENATISNIDVDAAFTSFTGTSTSGDSYSTTYSVAGVANVVNAGSTIEKCDVVLNLNKGVDHAKAYAAALVGGLVARYTGDANAKGLELKNNTVSGEAYVNYMYHQVSFSAVDQEGAGEDEFVPIFTAGGLVAMISNITADNVDKNYDAIAPVSVATTGNKQIASNKVADFSITAEFADENAELTASNTALYKYAYRVRAIGALVGVVYTQVGSHDVLDLSQENVISNVNIAAYEKTFTYEYPTAIEGHTQNVTLGGNYLHTYGISYKLNTGDASGVVDPTGFENEIHYTKIGQEVAA